MVSGGFKQYLTLKVSVLFICSLHTGHRKGEKKDKIEISVASKFIKQFYRNKETKTKHAQHSIYIFFDVTLLLLFIFCWNKWVKEAKTSLINNKIMNMAPTGAWEPGFMCVLSSLQQIWPETCQLSVDVKPPALMRRPGSRAIMAACDGGVSYHTNGGHRSRPSVVPRRPSNRLSGLPVSRRPPSRLSSHLIVGRGLICTGDKIRAAAFTRMHARSFYTPAVDPWCCDMCATASLT